MTALQLAEQLKAAHRAKLAAKAAEEERIKAEQKAASDANFTATVAVVLKNRDVEWLAEYVAETESDGPDERVMSLQLPGHQPIHVVFCSYGTDASGGTIWMDASTVCRSTWPWVVNGVGFLTLAEALCKAEELAESPIPL